MTFGEKLRKYRTEKRLSQAELAKLAGLGVNTISNYESGKTYPQNRSDRDRVERSAFLWKKICRWRL